MAWQHRGHQQLVGVIRPCRRPPFSPVQFIMTLSSPWRAFTYLSLIFSTFVKIVKLNTNKFL